MSKRDKRVTIGARVQFDGHYGGVVFHGRITGRSKDGHYAFVHVDGEAKPRAVKVRRLDPESNDYVSFGGGAA